MQRDRLGSEVITFPQALQKVGTKLDCFDGTWGTGMNIYLQNRGHEALAMPGVTSNLIWRLQGKC